jgi:thiosulfate dehydrogenase [quinone] large subunit
MAASAHAGDHRWEGRALAGVRILLGLLWLQNSGWKVPPAFRALGRSVDRGIDDPILPSFGWLLDAVVEPNLRLVGWVVLVTELALAVFLLVGLATRLWALVGAAVSLGVGLTVAGVPNEWGWSYWLMVAAHVAVAASPAAGRVAGLDGLVRPAVRDTSALGRFYLEKAS